MDKSMYHDVYEELSAKKNEVVFEAELPKVLRDAFGKLYLINLPAKQALANEIANDPHETMKDKYSIQVSRSHNQILGVLVDASAVREFYAEQPNVWKYKLWPKESTKRSPDQFGEQKERPLSPKSQVAGGKEQAVKRSASGSEVQQEVKKFKRREDPRLNRMCQRYITALQSCYYY